MAPAELLQDYVAIDQYLSEMHRVVSSYFVVGNSFILALVGVSVEVFYRDLVSKWNDCWLLFLFFLDLFWLLSSAVWIVLPIVSFTLSIFILLTSFAFLFLFSDIGQHLLLGLIFFALVLILNTLDFIFFGSLALSVETVWVLLTIRL